MRSVPHRRRVGGGTSRRAGLHAAGTNRTAAATEPGTTFLAVGGSPGKAYDATGWELWAPLVPLYESGHHAELASRLKAVIAANPQYPMLVYNLAPHPRRTGLYGTDLGPCLTRVLPRDGA